MAVRDAPDERSKVEANISIFNQMVRLPLVRKTQYGKLFSLLGM